MWQDLSLMDLRQLQAFLAVIEHGGFTAAARATHTVQSNISTHVARLERELDVILIDRATGQPTQEGDAVATRARRIQNELAALEADVSSLQGSPRGTVRIGVIGTTARWITPLLVHRLAQTAPDVDLVVIDATTTTQVLRLLDGELDLGIVALPVDDTDINSIPLFTEEHVLIAPTDHPLASADQPIALTDLTSYPLLLAAPGTTFRSEIDEAFRQAGARPKAKVEVDGLRLLASLSFSGFGLAIVPATAAPGWVGGDWVRLSTQGLGRRTVGLATRRKGMLSVATEAVATAVRHCVNADAVHHDGVDPFNA